ncbi:flagellar hook-length control protein FliK [Modicisalibacter coralii]|uniref:flagellar hook-length control protein FliK n=1 Tax=Modicisalibacter coralii TaxID=2304602 RepID=UPI00100A3A92|nr:flagellar hook-length control protein FliK [Halomonas coralii]
MAPTSLPSVSATTSSTPGTSRGGESASNGNLFAQLMASTGKLARGQDTPANGSESVGATGEIGTSARDLETMLQALKTAPEGDELTQQLEALLDRQAGLDGSTQEGSDPGELLASLLETLQDSPSQGADTLATLRKELGEPGDLDGIRERLDAIAGALGQPQAPIQPLSQAVARAAQANTANAGNAQAMGAANAMLASRIAGIDDTAAGRLTPDTRTTATTGLVAGDASTSAGGSNTLADRSPSQDFIQSLQTINNGGAATHRSGQDAAANTALTSAQLAAQFETRAPAGKVPESSGKGADAVSPSLLASHAPHQAGALQAGNGVASPTTAMTGGMPSATLAAPLGSGEWQQGLGQQLVNLHQRGDQQVQLHLHPAELGPLSVHLKVDDQLAQAQFLSNNPHVRAAIEQALPQLRAALGEAGIQLGDTTVGDQAQQQERNGDGNPGSSSQRGTLAFDGDSSEASGIPMTPLTLEANGVDLYA